MRLIITAVFVVLVLLLGSCKKEETGDPNYPTTINAISSDSLDQLIDDLSNTPLYQCTSVDTFGHCYITLKNKSCGDFDSIRVNYSQKDIASIFYESVLKYSNYLNLTDTAGIKIASIKNMNGMDFDKFKTTYPDSATIGWLITSNVQVINNYEIPGTEIKVLIFFDQVRSIEGKRYNGLYLPLTDVFSEELAEKSLMDREFIYNSAKLRITESTSWNKSEKIIFPITKSTGIELRVCWELHPGNWLIIVDTQTGEVLSFVKI